MKTKRTWQKLWRVARPLGGSWILSEADQEKTTEHDMDITHLDVKYFGISVDCSLYGRTVAQTYTETQGSMTKDPYYVHIFLHNNFNSKIVELGS